MLVPFVIDAESIAPDPDWTPAQLRNCHESFLGIWQRIGLMTHDADTYENSKLKNAVEKLPQKLRPLWQDVLARSPLRGLGAGWDGAVRAADVHKLIGATSLALVDDERAEVEFGLTEEELSKPAVGAPEIEVCRFLAASEAKRFQQAIAQSGIHIESGDTFNDIWDLRFKSLAAAPVKRITVVDRYAVSQHFFSPQTQLSGLERFLRLLDRDAGGARHVTLYSAWTAELTAAPRKTLQDVDAEFRIVMGRLTAQNIKRLKIIMVPNAGFRDDGHDRFLRFEEFVWDIGLGLEVLAGAFAAKRSSATFKAGVPVAGYKQVEMDLDRYPQAGTVQIP